jgi:type III pantothenate kinase
MDALVGRTAQLYKVVLQPPPSPVGRNTTHAIQSGLFWGYVGLIEGLVTRLKAAMPDGKDAKIIATGGLAPLFRDHTPVIQEIAPFLTLDGLRIIYELNESAT